MDSNLLENLPKSLCKVCNQEKIKVFTKLYKGGSCQYVDENGSTWYGRCCPDCRRSYKKERYGKNKI